MLVTLLAVISQVMGRISESVSMVVFTVAEILEGYEMDTLALLRRAHRADRIVDFDLNWKGVNINTAFD